MRRLLLFAVIVCLPLILSAQIQQGYVKTKGRMVNGQHVAGKGLPGATVNIQGGNSVGVKNANGSFSFAVPAKTYMVQSVQKKGYELVDADAVSKPYQHSANPLYLVMETPEQQMQDKLDAERKLRRTLQRQLQQREDEIDAMHATVEEKQRLLQQLYKDQENNEKLIADMAKEYSQMDYDQMDSLNQHISDAILNGRLMEADSLLRSKGDMKGRIAEIRKEQQAEAQEERELAQRQENLEISKEGTKKKLEDIAVDCYKFFDRFKLENQHDSASYYIELRAVLDTTNAEWQFDAARYFQKQNQFRKSRIYYERALEICRRLSLSNPQAYDPDVAMTLNNLAILYSDTQRLSESELMYKEALEIFRRHAQSNPQAYEPDVAMTLNNLAILYSDTQRLSESELMYKEALEIRRRLAQSNPQAYDPDVAQTLNNLAHLYQKTKCFFSESELMYKEALEICRRLAQCNPQAYDSDVAQTLNNLAVLYKNTKRFSESELMYKEALEIRRRLAQSNPQAYDPDVAQTLNNLAHLYQKTKCFKEALEIRRRLAQFNPQAYEPDVAQTLNNLAALYYKTQCFTESEAMYKEALEIRRRLVQSNPQAYEPYVAQTLKNLADLYYKTQRFTEGEAEYKEALEIYHRLAQSNPQAYDPDVAQIQYRIGLLKMDMKCYEEAIPPFEEVLNIDRRIFKTNPAWIQRYENDLNYLNLLYYAVKNYLAVYQLHQEWLPIKKEKYEADPESLQSEYAGNLANHSWCCIFAKQYAEAEQYAREGLAIDSAQYFIYSNLAVALLFQGRYEEAEQIYRQYKDELKDSFLDDFKQYAEAGVIPEERKTDVERIKRLIEE